LKKVRKYYTGLISSDWSFYPPAPYKGKEWEINLEKTPKCKGIGTTYYGNKLMENKEVTVSALNFISAQNALELIKCAILLTTGEPAISEIDIIKPMNEEEYLELVQKGWPINKSHYIHTDHFPLACMVAAKSSYWKLYKYALIKFGFASRLHSIFRIDIDPFETNEHLGVSPIFANHIRYAYSIIMAYSAIEEIGLEIRATEKNPSLINGKWNPFVVNNLQKRLIRAGIDLKETCPWVLRGKPTLIERSKQLPSKGKCPWAKGPYVRDCELEIIDAINIASFLRSKISSHKMDEKISSLTSYDVENVRMLARRLLLGRFGFWPPPFSPTPLDFAIPKPKWGRTIRRD
jgi:hypothetical protein